VAGKPTLFKKTLRKTHPSVSSASHCATNEADDALKINTKILIFKQLGISTLNQTNHQIHILKHVREYVSISVSTLSLNYLDK
jgi:hypothetical protein